MAYTVIALYRWRGATDIERDRYHDGSRGSRTPARHDSIECTIECSIERSIERSIECCSIECSIGRLPGTTRSPSSSPRCSTAPPRCLGTFRPIATPPCLSASASRHRPSSSTRRTRAAVARSDGSSGWGSARPRRWDSGHNCMGHNYLGHNYKDPVRLGLPDAAVAITI